MKNFYIIAHRGVTEYGLEDNSIKSLDAIKEFSNDIKLGIEFDIQFTLDNKIVLYHDEYLDGNRVEEMKYSEIITKKPLIIELEKVLNSFNNTDYLLNIEIKNYSNKIFRLKEFIENIKLQLEGYNLNYVFSSFDKNICGIFKDCLYISEDINENNVSITEYKFINEFNKLIGVYTLYDKNFEECILEDIIKKGVMYLITDNVEKLINYLYKD